MITQTIVLITGIALVYLAYKTSQKACPPPQIEYRFVPRTFEEEQKTPVEPSVIFKNMFDNPTPFVGTFTIGKDQNKEINSNFISQT
jgi:hypothetical protein